MFLFAKMNAPNKQILIDAVNMQMPFGKYKGRFLSDLPIGYLEWFSRKGFPKGKLGMCLQTLFVMKQNGLDDMLNTIKTKYRS